MDNRGERCEGRRGKRLAKSRKEGEQHPGRNGGGTGSTSQRALKGEEGRRGK